MPTKRKDTRRLEKYREICKKNIMNVTELNGKIALCISM